MKALLRLGLLLAMTSWILAGCSPNAGSTLAATAGSTAPAWVSVQEVEKEPEAFADRPVRMQGYGVMVATLPLCPGYLGLDRRTVFVDANQDRIPAVVRWDSLGQIDPYTPDRVRTFEGYVRLFEGEIGCPGASRVERFPYFEITAVK